MASIDDIVGQLQTASDKIEEAVTALNSAESDAGELQSQMAAAGIMDKQSLFGNVRDLAEQARERLMSGADLTGEATEAARAAGG